MPWDQVKLFVVMVFSWRVGKGSVKDSLLLLYLVLLDLWACCIGGHEENHVYYRPFTAIAGGAVAQSC